MSRRCRIGSTPLMPSRWLTRLPAPEPRAATRTPRVADQVGDLGDGEEVGGVAQGVDDAELVVEPGEHDLLLGVARAGVAPADGVAAALGEHLHRVGAGRDAEHLGLGQVHRADAEVGAGLLGALVGDQGGHRDQPVGAGAVAAGDLEGARVHRRGVGEVAGVGDPVEVARVEHDEPAGGVEQVDGAHLLGVGVAHRGGEHGGQAGGVGQAEQAGRVRAAAGGALRAAVVDDLDGQPVARQQRLPGARGGRGPARGARRAPPGRRRSRGRAARAAGSARALCPLGTCLRFRRPRGCEPGRRTSRDRSSGVGPAASRSGLVTGTPRSPRRWVSVTSRHSAAQPTPGAVPPPRPRASTVTRGRRGSTMAPPRTGVRGRGRGRPASGPVPPARGAAAPAAPGDERLDGEVDAEHRRDAGPAARRGEPDRAVEPVAVGERERALAVLGGALDEVPRASRRRSASRTPRRRGGGRTRRIAPSGRADGDQPPRPVHRRHAEAAGGEVDEGLGVAQQVVGLAGGDPHQPGLDADPLPGGGGEPLRPLGELGGDPGGERPDVVRAVAAGGEPGAGAGGRAGGDDRGTGPQRAPARRRGSARRRPRRHTRW